MPLVLLVMGVHFVPLWRVLGRASLLWMGAALVALAVLAFAWSGWLAAVLASLVSRRTARG